MPSNGIEQSVFSIDLLFSCKDIVLSTCCQNGRIQVLALYLSRGELLLCLLTESLPILRKIPWYHDEAHRPVALSFSPAGSFLLVLSESCHLYTVPAMSLLDPTFKSDMALSSSDISIFAYPFKRAPATRRTSYEMGSSSSSIKEASKRGEIVGSAVTWYQTLEECHQIGIIGSTNGDIILVDLLTGIRLATTSVVGEIRDLSICLDNWMDSVLLLITTKHQQYELTLELRIGWTPEKQKKRVTGSADDTDEETPKNYRGRLHGLKQMSVEKLQSIKLKIVETRARAQIKSPVDEVGNKPFLSDSPKPLDSALKGSRFRRQYFRGRYVLSSYHPPTQFLTVHSALSESNPLFVHKMPPNSDECHLTDRFIFVVSEDRRHVSVVSSHLSESRIDRDCEFNPESILGEFLVPDEADLDETVMAVYKNSAVNVPVDVPTDWKTENFLKLLSECECLESCLVVTQHRLLRISPSEHIVCTALRLILDSNDIVKAERLCKIFGINLSKLLELAGDIDLGRLRIPAAITRFKLASCGPLKITVKLAKLGHCSELLSYSTALLMAANVNLSLTDQMHISNLLLMAFVHQILAGAGAHLKKKFLTFLETNDYYDKGLGINISAQSLLFPAVHRLITARGLINDGFGVLGSVIKAFGEDVNLFAAAKGDGLWLCLSEPLLQEAYVLKPHVFRCWAAFMSRNLMEMPTPILERLCRALDPSAPYLRPHLRTPQTADGEESFCGAQLMQCFFSALLVKLSRETLVFDRSLMIPCEEAKEMAEGDDLSSSPAVEDSDDIWPIRKERRVSVIDQCDTKVISCGFGHTALLRNGAVYTWGLNNKGCLGLGPGLIRHSAPEPISFFGSVRIQVSQVSCGRAHTVALTNNGVYAWGSSALGQLGLGREVMESPYPRLVKELASHRVIRVECGQYHTMYLTHSGQLLGTGWNVHGQLGLGTVDNVYVPQVISKLREHVIVGVACGHAHTLVLTDKGHVMTFGCSMFGQLGHGSLMKCSSPILVNKISGKVIMIASGYFHSLALTAQNQLYFWGASPQVLRLQSQAHKRARAIHLVPEGGEAEQGGAEVAASEAHLSPSLVDTRNVSGRISQIACGCHHYALTTDSGSVYTWGRSIDGQLGNGARTEVVLPSLIQDGSLKASSIALGCDFTVVVEKMTGRVFGWGSNGSRQLGVPIKDSAVKGADGKIIIVKTVKKVVRIPNSVSNAIDSPVEVPGIPSSTFTYQPLISCVSAPCPPPPTAYTQQLWHSRLQSFSNLVNHDLLLCKCLEVGNHQAASKVLLFRGQYRQAVVHQLKALQKSQKEKFRSRQSDIVNANEVRKVVQTPDTEMHQFTVEGGVEGMCDMVDNTLVNGQAGIPSCQKLDPAISEYSSAAVEILLRFLLYAPEENAADILETGIQFWTAEKLPMNNLEAFLLEHLERVFYPLGTLLYLGKRDLAKHFSAELQLRVTTRLVAHVENNGSCEEFVSALSKLLSLGKTSVADLGNKLQNPPQKAIHVSWPQHPTDGLYVFSCGHSTTKIVVPSEQKKIAEAYARLDVDGAVDMACPECVCTLAAQVA